jgi:hypothetical protein
MPNDFLLQSAISAIGIPMHRIKMPASIRFGVTCKSGLKPILLSGSTKNFITTQVVMP